MSGRVGRCRVSVLTCSAWSRFCRDVLGDVGLFSVRVRRRQVIVETCSSMSAYCRYVFCEVVFVTGRVG